MWFSTWICFLLKVSSSMNVSTTQRSEDKLERLVTKFPQLWDTCCDGTCTGVFTVAWHFRNFLSSSSLFTFLTKSLVLGSLLCPLKLDQLCLKKMLKWIVLFCCADYKVCFDCKLIFQEFQNFYFKSTWSQIRGIAADRENNCSCTTAILKICFCQFRNFYLFIFSRWILAHSISLDLFSVKDLFKIPSQCYM